MKKIFAGIIVTFVVALMSLGLTTSAHAYPDDNVGGNDSGVLSGDVDSEGSTASGAANASGSGILPATGGPQTLLLVGGAALVAVGGVALVATRRRADAS